MLDPKYLVGFPLLVDREYARRRERPTSICSVQELVNACDELLRAALATHSLYPYLETGPILLQQFVALAVLVQAGAEDLALTDFAGTLEKGKPNG